MANKKPGIAPLGHAPMSKVKLEGPKRHHDFHGMTDSVPAKGNNRAVPGEHWEMHYSDSYVHDQKGKAGSEWNPKIANTRTATHNKVNREDH